MLQSVNPDYLAVLIAAQRSLGGAKVEMAGVDEIMRKKKTIEEFALDKWNVSLDPDEIYDRYSKKLESANPCVKLYIHLRRYFINPVLKIDDKQELKSVV